MGGGVEVERGIVVVLGDEPSRAGKYCGVMREMRGGVSVLSGCVGERE